jgi:hypothetical protein
LWPKAHLFWLQKGFSFYPFKLKPFTFKQRHCIVFFSIHLGFLLSSFEPSFVIAMADGGVINLDNATIFEKCGHGRPRGSKNKPKTTATSASSAPAKHRHGCPLGSRNKKPSPATADATNHLDVSFAHPILPQSPTENLFSFFVFTGAQCHEQQRLPLKFMEFMDGRELREAILREVSSGRPPYELEVYYDSKVDVFFKGCWPCFAEDHDLHQGWILMFNYHCGTTKFDVKIFDGT